MKRLKPFLIVSLGVLVLGYLATGAFLYLLQDELLFFPGPPPVESPEDVGLEYSDVWLTSPDEVRLHGWWFPVVGGRGVVLVAHGNAGNIGRRLFLVQAFQAMGLAVMLFDYRGYGNSEGTPSESGLYLDAETFYDHLIEEKGFEHDQVVLFGKSLGGGVVIELAGRRPCAGLITEGAFTSLPDMAATLYPWFPVRLLSRNQFANIEKVGSLDQPYLLLHSPEDEVVPFDQAERLFAAAKTPKYFVETSGSHNSGGLMYPAPYVDQVKSFLKATLDIQD